MIRPNDQLQLRNSEVIESEDIIDELAPVIVEPSTLPRQRTRLDRPLSDVSGLYQSTPNSKIRVLPARLSSWFSLLSMISPFPQFFPNKHTYPVLLPSPSVLQRAGARILLTATKHGKGRLDMKATRYLLASDSIPDNCTDPTWLLGLKHPSQNPLHVWPSPTLFDSRPTRISRFPPTAFR